VEAVGKKRGAGEGGGMEQQMREEQGRGTYLGAGRKLVGVASAGDRSSSEEDVVGGARRKLLVLTRLLPALATSFPVPSFPAPTHTSALAEKVRVLASALPRPLRRCGDVVPA
jgi:hypothetical protein